MVALNNERLGGVDDESLQPLGNPAQGILGQWPLALEYGGARDRPVDDVRSSRPRQQLARSHLGTGGIAMGRLWPHDGGAIPASNQEQALADSGGAVVTGAQFTPLHSVALAAQGVDEAVEGAALLGRVRASVALRVDQQRAPGLKLFDVLQHDHPGAYRGGPAQSDPRQAPDLLADRSRALRLGEMLAVWAQPDEPDRAARHYIARHDIPYRLAIVLCGRVVDGVHGNRVRVVVDGDLRAAAQRHLDPGRRPAATGEVVHDDFVEQVEGVAAD
ncbi:hypothetical protein D3C84_644010 [compost metagenome]